MEKKLIVIVDTDESYLAPLEYKLVEEWEEYGDIEVITQLQYFQDFFNQPRNIYMLVINEVLYNEKVQKQNCRHVFILKEEDKKKTTYLQDKRIHSLYKYSSVKEIYAEILKEIRMDTEHIPVDQTRLYVMYAACGGSGKTISGLGLCSALSDLGKRVLYINAESYQDFGYYLKDKGYASASFGYALATDSSELIRKIEDELGNDEFDYLKPFEKSTLSYQISDQNYMNLVEQIKNMKKYDVIMLEVSRDLTKEKLMLMERADKVINVCLQTEEAAYKNEKLLTNMNWKKEQWVFLCNRYKNMEENALSNQVSLGMYEVVEYIEEQENALLLQDIRTKGLFDKTAYFLE